MNRALAKYLWYTLRGTFFVSLAVLTVTVLLWSKPLASAVVLEGRGTSNVLFPLMFLYGLFVAGIVFRESVGVGVWLSCRGVTRQSIFKTRCWVGFLALCAATVWCGLLMAIGLRQFVQLQLGSPFFPMVRWYELRVLPDLFVCAVIPFSLAIAFTMAVRSRVTNAGQFWYRHALVVGGAVALPLLVSAPFSRIVAVVFAWLVPLVCYVFAILLARENELSG
ncbi:MAG: hypothetical protein ABJZ55_10000 [Fuerstiella sp.]